MCVAMIVLFTLYLCHVTFASENITKELVFHIDKKWTLLEGTTSYIHA